MSKIRLIVLDAFNTLFRVRKPPGYLYAAELARLGIYLDPIQLQASFKDAFQTQSKISPNFGYGSIGAELWWKQVGFSRICLNLSR